MGVHNSKEAILEVKHELGIPEDEPIFIIRAQDQVSVLTLTNYMAHAKSAGCSKEFIASLADVSMEFTRWRIANPGKVKVPD